MPLPEHTSAQQPFRHQVVRHLFPVIGMMPLWTQVETFGLFHIPTIISQSGP